MKKTALLHGGLSQLVAGLGHGDLVVIADAGLPVPPGTPCIDLALTRGVPSLDQVLQALLSEMQVERATLAGARLAPASDGRPRDGRQRAASEGGDEVISAPSALIRNRVQLAQ